MPYTPLNWVAGVTPLSEFNLDHLETQYDQAVADIGKEIFVPCVYGNLAGGGTVYGDFLTGQLNDAAHFAVMTFKVPRDFTAITNAEIIVIPRATQGAADWDIATDYGAVGQLYNAHSEADAARTYNVVNNTLFAVSIATELSALVANDYVGVRITQGTAGHNVNVVGIRLRYS